MASTAVVRNIKCQPFAKVISLYQLISHLAWVIMFGRSSALPNLVWNRWAFDTPCGGNICGFCDYFIFIQQPIPARRVTRTIAQKTRSVVRKTCLGWEMWGIYPYNESEWAITCQNKMLNNGKRYAKCVNEPWLWIWDYSFRFRLISETMLPT